MASVVKTKSGKNITLLNPWEKGNKFFKENVAGFKITNNGDIKDNYAPLTDTERAYRSGYLAAQKDSRKAFKAKHPRYKNKTANEY